VREHESISIVVPVFDEAENLRPLYEAISRQLVPMGIPYEIIFVDDGSLDASIAVLRELHAADPRVRVMSLSRNFGHQNSISAGLEHAGGEAVIIMDADLQHPPELIPAMIARWREGYQVVFTVRQGDGDAGLFKRLTSAAFYKCINAVSEVPIIPGAADFRLMDRAVVDCLISMPERSRFLRGMVSWVGFRQTGLAYVASPRAAGKSKYSLGKMFGLAAQGITSFSSLPLRISGYVGFFAAVSVVPYAIWALYAKLFTNQTVSGWTSLLISVLFLGGVQLMSLGIIGEYVGRIFTEVKKRPLYVTKELVGFEGADAHPLPLSQETGLPHGGAVPRRSRLEKMAS
jgi:dolichol-phosphate mannosyltransferase